MIRSDDYNNCTCGLVHMETCSFGRVQKPGDMCESARAAFPVIHSFGCLFVCLFARTESFDRLHHFCVAVFPQLTMMRSLQAKRIGSLRLWSADPIIGAHVHRGVSGYNRVTSYRNIQYTAQQGNVVDLRSDTVTMPSEPMFQAALSAPLGDDVMGEDPTVLKLEEHVADMFGKEKALFLPTCTMANLVAGMAHCNQRANEVCQACSIGRVHRYTDCNDKVSHTPIYSMESFYFVVLLSSSPIALVAL